MDARASAHELGSMYPSGGPSHLLAAVEIPSSHPYYVIHMARVPPSYASARWYLNGESSGDFSIRCHVNDPGFENLVMTRTKDENGAGVTATRFINHPTQIWRALQLHGGHRFFLVPGTPLAIQPVRLAYQGSPLVLGVLDGNGNPTNAQTWVTEK